MLVRVAVVRGEQRGMSNEHQIKARLFTTLFIYNKTNGCSMIFHYYYYYDCILVSFSFLLPLCACGKKLTDSNEAIKATNNRRVSN